MILNLEMVQAIENSLVGIRNFELETRIGMLAQSAFDTDQIVANHVQGLVFAVFKFDRTRDQIGVDMRRNRGRFTVVIHKADPKRIMLPVIITDAAMA